jgi:hypothetical protein
VSVSTGNCPRCKKPLDQCVCLFGIGRSKTRREPKRVLKHEPKPQLIIGPSNDGPIAVLDKKGRFQFVHTYRFEMNENAAWVAVFVMFSVVLCVLLRILP